MTDLYRVEYDDVDAGYSGGGSGKRVHVFDTEGEARLKFNDVLNNGYAGVRVDLFHLIDTAVSKPKPTSYVVYAVTGSVHSETPRFVTRAATLQAAKDIVRAAVPATGERYAICADMDWEARIGNPFKAIPLTP